MVTTTAAGPTLRTAWGNARRRWRTLGADWRLAIWLLVVLRLGLEVVAVVGLRLFPPRAPVGSFANLIIRDGIGGLLLSPWQRYDALVYHQIAAHGYQAGVNTAAFYPLYPLVSRLVALPFGGQIVLAQLVVSSVAFVVTLRSLYQLARLDVGPRAARLAVWAMALFPSGFILLLPYTESLFLALALPSLWYARRGRPWTAGALALAAGLTRVHGLLLVLPLAVENLRQARAQGSLPGPALLAALTPLAGYAVFLGYLQLIIGEPRSPLEIQQTWGVPASPAQVLPRAVAALLQPDSAGILVALTLIAVILFCLLAIGVTARLPLSYALYAWPGVLGIMARETMMIPLMSGLRYLLVVFPCFILLGLLLARRQRLALAWLMVSLMLQVLLFDHVVHWNAAP
jgi:hypothetical protein